MELLRAENLGHSFDYPLFENLNFSKTKEILDVIYEDEKVRVERILSLNQVSDFYDQEELELVFLLDGFAEILMEEKIIKLKKGDFLKISPHKIHKVILQKNAIWLCIFLKNI